MYDSYTQFALLVVYDVGAYNAPTFVSAHILTSRELQMRGKLKSARRNGGEVVVPRSAHSNAYLLQLSDILRSASNSRELLTPNIAPTSIQDTETKD
ncbi:hypothetical protein PsYK624_049860 [Phanerochaete sordida]|uniref:Uncharacterized protein n=1 Tax=Phanerochaete sordida TaxID=48140 RepID=A0A9P3G5Z5_9APHY|nr:hypothetical protein PsYK624_049860 [Phanerochaete sordida]